MSKQVRMQCDILPYCLMMSLIVVLGTNDLTGEIPESLGNLTELNFVSLGAYVMCILGIEDFTIPITNISLNSRYVPTLSSIKTISRIQVEFQLLLETSHFLNT